MKIFGSDDFYEAWRKLKVRIIEASKPSFTMKKESCGEANPTLKLVQFYDMLVVVIKNIKN